MLKYALFQGTSTASPTSRFRKEKDEEEPKEVENEVDVDGAADKDDLYYDKNDCSMQEYEIMKVREVKLGEMR